VLQPLGLQLRLLQALGLQVRSPKVLVLRLRLLLVLVLSSAGDVQVQAFLPQARRCSPGALQSRPSCGPNVVRAAAWLSDPKLIDAAQAPCGAGLHADRILFVRRLGFSGSATVAPGCYFVDAVFRRARALAFKVFAMVPVYAAAAAAGIARLGQVGLVSGARSGRRRYALQTCQRATLVPLYGPGLLEFSGNWLAAHWGLSRGSAGRAGWAVKH